MSCPIQPILTIRNTEEIGFPEMDQGTRTSLIKNMRLVHFAITELLCETREYRRETRELMNIGNNHSESNLQAVSHSDSFNEKAQAIAYQFGYIAASIGVPLSELISDQSECLSSLEEKVITRTKLNESPSFSLGISEAVVIPAVSKSIISTRLDREEIQFTPQGPTSEGRGHSKTILKAPLLNVVDFSSFHARSAVRDSASDDASIIDESPITDESPIIDESPAADESPVIDESPAADESPVTDESPPTDESPLANSIAVAGLSIDVIRTEIGETFYDGCASPQERELFLPAIPRPGNSAGTFLQPGDPDYVVSQVKLTATKRDRPSRGRLSSKPKKKRAVFKQKSSGLLKTTDHSTPTAILSFPVNTTSKPKVPFIEQTLVKNSTRAVERLVNCREVFGSISRAYLHNTRLCSYPISKPTVSFSSENKQQTSASAKRKSQTVIPIGATKGSASKLGCVLCEKEYSGKSSFYSHRRTHFFKNRLHCPNTACRTVWYVPYRYQRHLKRCPHNQPRQQNYPNSQENTEGTEMLSPPNSSGTTRVASSTWGIKNPKLYVPNPLSTLKFSFKLSTDLLVNLGVPVERTPLSYSPEGSLADPKSETEDFDDDYESKVRLV